MTLKTSLFKKSLIISDIKRFWWISAIYTLLLFFILPLRHLLLKNGINDEWIRREIQNSLYSGINNNGLQLLLLIFIPIIIATLVFQYLQKNKAAAMAHSLPFNRRTLYCSHATAGLFLISLPIIIIASVLMLLMLMTNLKEYYSFIHIVQWGGYTLLFQLLFFASTVFVGMFTGSSIAQIAFTFILHVLPAGLYILLQANIERLFYGYNSRRWYTSMLEHYLPIFTVLNGRLERSYIPMGIIISYGIVALILLIGGYYVYKIRNIEVSGDIIAFRGIGPLFKYGVTICSMLLGGAYFSSFTKESFFAVIFVYFLSSFLGYWIAQMLMEKSFKVWKAYKGYVAYTVIMLLILVGVYTDITGYVGRVPAPEEVDKVYLGSLYEWMHMEEMEEETSIFRNGYLFENEEDIKNIIALHRNLIDTPHNHNIEAIYRYYDIVYALKNGKNLVRRYAISEEIHGYYLKPIYESLEYKKTRFPILNQKADEIKWIEIMDPRVEKKSVVISDTTEIQEFIKVLQNEVYDATFETLIKPLENYPLAAVMDSKGIRIDYAIRNDYTSVIEWLKEKGYYDAILLQLEDIEYMVLEKLNEQYPQRIEIRDKNVIKELLDLTSYTYYSRTNIAVGYYATGYKNQYYRLGFLYEDTNVSMELRYYLNQLNKEL